MTNYQKFCDVTPACGCRLSVYFPYSGVPPQMPPQVLQSLALMCIIDFNSYNAGCGKNLLDEDTGTDKDGGAGGTIKNFTARLSRDEGARGIVSWCYFS